MPPIQLRRQLPAAMAVQPWAAPDGWPLRAFLLPAADPARGSVLFLGGRGDFFEKYLEAIDDWHREGWHVSGFDWRGQGGSGALHPGGACHLDDFRLLLDDLAAFVSDWRTRQPSPHVVIGHSLGGHLLLRAVAERRISPDGVVLLAPMLGIRAGLLRGRALRGVTLLGKVPGLHRRALWTGTKSPTPGRITSCTERQADKLWWKAQQPELARGGPTWGWLNAATRSIAALDRLLRTRPPAVPGLLLAAAGDPVVDPAAIRRALRLLPSFEHATIAGAGHEMLRERDGPREAALSRIQQFLDRIGRPAELSPATAGPDPAV